MHLRHSSVAFGLKKAGFVDAGGDPVKNCSGYLHLRQWGWHPDHPCMDAASLSAGKAGQLYAYPF